MTGSLQIKTLPSGKRYFYTVIDVASENGKRKQKWQSTGLEVKGNKKKAEKVLRERLKEYEMRTFHEDAEMMFSDWIEIWLNSIQNQIEKSTWEGYFYPVQHVKNYFSEKKLRLKELKPIHFEEYYTYMLTEGNSKDKKQTKGLKPKTVRQHRLVINLSLDKAVMLEILPTNPAKNIRVTNKKNSDYQKPLNILTVQESAELLDFLYKEKDELADCVKATLLLGLRKSELLGLTEDSIDFQRHTLTIHRTVVKVRTTYEKERTKTQSSRRTYCLNQEMEDFFKGLIEKKKKNRLFYGDTYVHTRYLFTWENGKRYAPDYIYHHFKRMIKKFGRPELTFHDLRHSTASILYEKGWEVKDIQEWLGHADVQTTLNIYTHLSKGHKEEKVKTLEGIFDVEEDNVRNSVRTEGKIAKFPA